MPLIKLRLLGPFAATGPHGDLGALPKKAQGMLAMLALSPTLACRRSYLVGKLWSDREEGLARASLRQAIGELRRVLDQQERKVLRAEREFVGLEPDAVSIDLLQFERHAADPSLPATQMAAGLYRGELLEGLAIRDEAFEEWLRQERARLQDLAASVLLRLVTAQDAVDHDIVIEAAHKLLSIDAAQEEGHRALLRCYLQRGQIGLARRQLEACRQVLDEFGAEPEPLTLALFEEVRQRGEGRRAPRAGTEPASRAADPLARPRALAKPRLAALPFENLSGKPDETYFARGITEDMCTALGRFGNLELIAPYSSFRQAETTADILESGKRLGADYVLVGSVRRAERRLRISARLIELGRGVQIWAETRDRDIHDIFEVQSELARAIAAVLPGRVEEAQRGRALTTSELSAYDHVLRASYLLGRATPETNRQAREHLSRAIEIDTTYARAYREAALACFDSVFMRWTPESELAEALRLAHFAVDLDPNDGGSHKVMGMVLFLQGRDEEAREHLERAEALNPIDADIISHAALFRAYTGDAATALDRMALAMELNPYHPDWYWAALGTAAFAAGDEETSLRAFRRRQDQDRLVCAYIAACLASLGRAEEAGRQRERCLELCRSEGYDAALLLREEAGLYRRAAERGRFLDRLQRAGFEVTAG